MALDWTPALLQEAKRLYDAWKQAQDNDYAMADAPLQHGSRDNYTSQTSYRYQRLVEFLYDDANKAMRYVLPMGTDEWSKKLAEFMRKYAEMKKVPVITRNRKAELEYDISLTKRSIEDNEKEILKNQRRIQDLTYDIKHYERDSSQRTKTVEVLKEKLPALEAELARLTTTKTDLQLISHRIDRLMSLIERQ